MYESSAAGKVFSSSAILYDQSHSRPDGKDLQLAHRLPRKGFEIEKNAITIPGKIIKRLGNYEAKIRLHREVSIRFPFEIIPEKK